MSINISVLIPSGEIRDMFITPAVKQAFMALGNLRLNDGLDYEKESIKGLLKDCHVCITGWGCPTLDESLLESAQNLRLIAHTGAAVAGIVSDYVYDKGIKVISGNEPFAESVAEGTLAYMLSALRRIPFYSRMVEDGSWRTASCQNKGILDKKIGLIGFGAIPRYLVPMLKPFRVEIHGYDPFVSSSVLHEHGVKPCGSLEALFSECDIVSNHLPLTKDTFHIINAELLNRMKKGTLFVNTARGSTVDEAALGKIVQSGHIDAVLDVYEKEPLPATSKLRGLDNVILMPHMGGPTLDRYEMVSLGLAKEIRRMINNEPLLWEISKDYAFKMTNDKLM